MLPRWIAANVVTLVSAGSLAAIIVASLAADRIGPAGYAMLQFVVLQVYVTGDHLDGMQAAATDTKSPLGDFLDHHCDLWAGCILCFGFWDLAGNAPVWELYLLTAVLIVGFAITFVERAERRSLHFTALGTLEAIALLSAFYLSWCIPSVRAWWQAPWIGGLARHAIMAAVGIVIASGAIIVIWRRLRPVPGSFLVFAATLAVLGAWCAARGPGVALWGWSVVVLAGADYVARAMHAHWTVRGRPWPWQVTGLCTTALWVLPADSAWAIGVFIGLTVWLAASYAATLFRILGGWRHHWSWLNDPARADA